MTLGSGAVQSKRKIAADLTAIGVAGGDILLVHTSLRAVGPVEDGPRGLIDALLATLGPGGTLVMPSWTGDDATPFDAQTTRASSSLGIVPETFWRMDGVVRSAHAFAVAAHGPRAKAITAGELPIPPHAPDSPIGHLHDLDGKVLLLGVGHDANTSLHLAELIGGAPYRVPKHITILENGRPKRLDYGENDHCCQLFAQADGWLRDRGWQREGVVGRAPARLFRARDLVAVARGHLARDPLVFLHPAGAGCEECDDARRSVATP